MLRARHVLYPPAFGIFTETEPWPLIVPPCRVMKAFIAPAQLVVPIGRNATESPLLAALPLTVMKVDTPT